MNVSRTKVVQVDKDEPDERIIKEAGELIKAGGLVAFPTETVYGLGANAFDGRAAKKIYAAKGRPSDNPLIVHIASVAELERIAPRASERAMLLAQEYWPGPLTMILRKADIVPNEVTGGLETVAVRLPKHEVARRFIAASGGYVAAPSANLSGRPSPTKAAHVVEDLFGRVDMIIDAGEADIGLESTIVDLTTDIPAILRPGYITTDQIRRIAGEAAEGFRAIGADGGAVPKAPGMKYRHYAPKGEMTLVEGDAKKVAEFINGAIAKKTRLGESAAVLCSEENKALYEEAYALPLGSLKDDDEIAFHLFGALRAMDEKGVCHIYSETFDTKRIGAAIMNRLLKAAGNRVVQV